MADIQLQQLAGILILATHLWFVFLEHASAEKIRGGVG